MKEIDWSKLGFHYTEPDYIVRAAYHDGHWEEPYATKDKYLHLHVSATCLQYGQEAFEGLKAFRGEDGKIRIFRWRENAKRMARSAEGLYMQPVPEELFGKAIRLALEKNLDFVPPYGTGATLYFRPLLIGTTPRLGVGPGRDFEFIVIPSPVRTIRVSSTARPLSSTVMWIVRRRTEQVSSRSEATTHRPSEPPKPPTRWVVIVSFWTPNSIGILTSARQRTSSVSKVTST